MWFDETVSVVIGPIMGIAGGAFGALLGIMLSHFLPEGKHKKGVTLVLRITIALFAILACVGLAALVSGQPYHVWYPLLLGGGSALFVFSFMYAGVKRQYEKWETPSEGASHASGKDMD